MGCTVVEMLTGRPPLGDLEPAAAMFRIGSKPTEPNLPNDASKAAKDFITACLTWFVWLKTYMEMLEVVRMNYSHLLQL